MRITRWGYAQFIHKMFITTLGTYFLSTCVEYWKMGVKVGICLLLYNVNSYYHHNVERKWDVWVSSYYNGIKK